MTSQENNNNIATEENNEDVNRDLQTTDQQPLVDPESQIQAESTLNHVQKKKSFVSVAFALVSLVLIFGALAMPRWSSLFGGDGVQIGDYGLFVVRLTVADEFNNTSIEYHSFVNYFNAGELSLIVLIFNIALTVMGIIVSLGCCPIYLNFLSTFSVFNVFAIINYLVAMGLWLWVTYRIPFHDVDAQIRKIYPDVTTQFGYGFYIWLVSVALLTLAAICNLLDYKMIRTACRRRQNSITLTTTHIPMRQPIRQIIVRLPSEPPAYREELSPIRSPLSPPIFPPSHLARISTSIV